jgi:hypothetical protein
MERFIFTSQPLYVVLWLAASSWGAQPNIRESSATVLANHAKNLACVRMTLDLEHNFKGNVLFRSKQTLELPGVVLREDGLTIISSANVDLALGSAGAAGSGDEQTLSPRE